MIKVAVKHMHMCPDKDAIALPKVNSKKYMCQNVLPTTAKLKQIADFYDKEAAEYDKNYSSPLCEAENKIITSHIAPHIKGKVIDVGCGTGLLLDYLPIKKYCGLDISEKMIKRARTKHPKMFFGIGDMHSIPYPENTFNSLVSLYGPMSYSLNPDTLLAEFSRVLIPGGKMILMPYTKRAEHNFFLGEHSTAVNNDIPKIYYSSETLGNLFNRCPYLESVTLFGISYFVNYLDYIAKEYEIFHTSEFYYDLLSRELKDYNLPIEYARHALVIATKKLNTTFKIDKNR